MVPRKQIKKISSVNPLLHLGLFLLMCLLGINFGAALVYLGQKLYPEPDHEIYLGSPAYVSRLQVKAKVRIMATAYTSRAAETDDTPCITADGFNVCEDYRATGVQRVVAANFLPLDTKIRIPALFGGQVFTVHDRMNPRYYRRLDVWFPSTLEAREFGKRYVDVEILDE